jgi:hypothetical protein
MGETNSPSVAHVGYDISKKSILCVCVRFLFWGKLRLEKLIIIVVCCDFLFSL